MWLALGMALLMSTAPDAGATAPATRIRGPGPNRVPMDVAIFPAAGKGEWTPTKEEVLAIEGQLPSFLESRRRDVRAQVIAKRLASYKRQYRGVTRAGRRFVEVNALCERFLGADDRDRWLRTWIVVKDGGDCFFQVAYDVERGELGGLYIHGEA